MGVQRPTQRTRPAFGGWRRYRGAYLIRVLKESGVVPPELVTAPAPAVEDPRYHDVANAGRNGSRAIVACFALTALFSAHRCRSEAAALSRLKEGHSSASPSKSMYSSATCPSATGNKASHFTQLNLLCRPPSGTSIVTMMYFAPQLGQANAIGSDFLVRQRAGIARNKQNTAGRSC